MAKRNGADFQLLCEIEEPFHRVKQYETLKDLENWILDICYRLCEQTAQREKQKNYNRLTVNAVFYIDHNYARPISLSDAAEYLQVSSSYLSRIFKNDTGMNFVNYLNQVRIDKARSMLEGQPGFYFIDGFVKDDIMEKVLEFFYGIKAEEMAKDMHEFSHQFLPYVEVDILNNWNAILTNILSGVLCLFIDGYDSCLAIDCRTYPMRSVEEPRLPPGRSLLFCHRSLLKWRQPWPG